tara:strand:+ start:848 stop:1198 length:351 start_codon:yes stop_codon:yes gene_type:complete
MRKWLLRLVTLFIVSAFGFFVYVSCCFELFPNETTLLRTIIIASNESLNIYHSPSNAVSQPTIFVMHNDGQREEFLEVFEPYEYLDSNFVTNDTLNLLLSNRMGRRDTFKLPIHIR